MTLPKSFKRSDNIWYLGGKIRLSKHIVPIIESYIENENTLFIDLFCGGCNIVDKISKTNNKIANDNHKHLVNMWIELQKGWKPSNLEYTKKYYDYVKNNQNKLPSHLVGLVGFHYSYGGKWWGGFAKSRYEDHIQRSVSKTLEQVQLLNDVKFTCYDYKYYSNIKDAVIYCDPPYKKTTQSSTRYNVEFNHEEFWGWCRMMSKNNIVLVSECDVPSDVKVLWQKVHNSNMSQGLSTMTNEKLVLVRQHKRMI